MQEKKEQLLILDEIIENNITDEKEEKTSYLFSINNYIYYPISSNINTNFHYFMKYNAYQNTFKWINKKYNNHKYHKIIISLKLKLQKTKIKKKSIFIKYPNFKFIFVYNFIFLYNCFFLSIFLDLYNLIKFLKAKKKNYFYFLFLSFWKNKFFINLKNFHKKNYLSLSTGLFIKFFEKRKSIKKNKSIKLLMAKQLRKVFLITKIRNIILTVKSTPLYLNEIINFLNTPIAHKFIDPIRNDFIEEDQDIPFILKFHYFVFIQNKNFTRNKLPSKGRIKRKILRKIIFQNKIID